MGQLYALIMIAPPHELAGWFELTTGEIDQKRPSWIAEVHIHCSSQSTNEANEHNFGSMYIGASDRELTRADTEGLGKALTTG